MMYQNQQEINTPQQYQRGTPNNIGQRLSPQQQYQNQNYKETPQQNGRNSPNYNNNNYNQRNTPQQNFQNYQNQNNRSTPINDPNPRMSPQQTYNNQRITPNQQYQRNNMIYNNEQNMNLNNRQTPNNYNMRNSSTPNNYNMRNSPYENQGRQSPNHFNNTSFRTLQPQFNQSKNQNQFDNYNNNNLKGSRTPFVDYRTGQNVYNPHRFTPGNGQYNDIPNRPPSRPFGEISFKGQNNGEGEMGNYRHNYSNPNNYY